MIAGMDLHVRALGTHPLSTRSTPASGGMKILALRGFLFIRVDLVLAAMQPHSSIDDGEARGGRGSCRSRKSGANCCKGLASLAS